MSPLERDQQPDFKGQEISVPTDSNAQTQVDFAELFQVMPGHFCLTDHNGTILATTPEFSEAFSGTHGAAAGHRFFDGLQNWLGEARQVEAQNLICQWPMILAADEGASVQIPLGHAPKSPGNESIPTPVWQVTVRPLGQAGSPFRNVLLEFRSVAEEPASQVPPWHVPEDRFVLAAAGSSAGIWDWDMLTNRVIYSSRFIELLGYEPHEFAQTLENWQSRLHPDDVENTLAAVQAHLIHRRPYKIEYRLRKKDETYCWFLSGGQAQWNPHGQATRMCGAIADINEQRKTEQTLRDSEAKYRQLFQENPNPMYVYDCESLGIMAVNQSALCQFDYAENDFLNLNLADLIVPEQGDKLEKVTRTVSGKLRHVGAWQFRKSDGQVIDCEVSTHDLMFDQRQARLVLAYDVTERVELERDLKFHQQRLRETLRLTQMGYWDYEIKTQRFQWSEELQEVFDLEFNQQDNTPLILTDLILDEDRPVAKEDWQRAIHQGIPFDHVIRFSIHDALRAIRVIGEIHRDATGAPQRLSGSMQDITEVWQARLAAQRGEAWLKQAIINSPHPAMIHAQDGEIVMINEAWSHASGYGRERFHRIEDWIQLAIPADEAELVRQKIQSLYLPGQSFKAELVHPVSAAGLSQIWELRSSHLGSLADGRNAVLTVAVDMTERLAAEEEIRRLNAELEERVLLRTRELEFINKELESFSYSVSHDLRAPLRAMGGFSRILLRDYFAALPAKAQQYLELISANAEQMGRLIDDLLSFSRLNRQSLSRQTVSMHELVANCWASLANERGDRAIEFRLQPLPPAQGDPALLQQAWINLLSNAIKYTRRRELAVIEVGFQQPALSTMTPTYYVRDNGVGFDMRYVHKLFGVFQRLHRAEDYEGTGVGLAIVQRIVHRHGGTIKAESIKNSGATFFFNLAGPVQP